MALCVCHPLGTHLLIKLGMTVQGKVLLTVGGASASQVLGLQLCPILRDLEFRFPSLCTVKLPMTLFSFLTWLGSVFAYNVEDPG